MVLRTTAAVVLASTSLPGVAPAQLSAADSVALHAELREKTFSFLMDWRYEWWVEKGELAFDRDYWSAAQDYRPSYAEQICLGAPDPGREPGTDPVGSRGQAAADLAAARDSSEFVNRCGRWLWPRARVQQPDPRLEIDLLFTEDVRPQVRELRKPLLAALDSGARRLPGDGWIAGQRVRMHLDQGQSTQAIEAASECKAEGWWCSALRGFVWYSLNDFPRAEAAFDSALGSAPEQILCEWNDLSSLFPGDQAPEYRALGCLDLERDWINERIWWLAKPLLLESVNDRKVEHYGRVMLATLRSVTDGVDGVFDYRFRDRGMLTEIRKYGYPITGRGCHENVCKEWQPRPPAWLRPVGFSTRGLAINAVQRFRRFDTRDIYLGASANYAWIGPQYHTVPSWAAVMEPFAATPADWDLGPALLDRHNWDETWWPPEFYPRQQGPLFELPVQVAFFRRADLPFIAAAAEWDTLATFRLPPDDAVFGMALSRGPRDTVQIMADRITGTYPPTIVTSLPAEPTLIGIEMIPMPDAQDGSAARTRFGAMPPPPLSALPATSIALSDPVLVRLDSLEDAPGSLDNALDRMFGTTRLADPRRLAVAWEVYGIAEGDTVDIALRFIRRNESGVFARAASAIGIGRVDDDSLVIRWREPRSDDRPPVIDGGHEIRFRSVAVDVSNLAAGYYTLEVVMERGLATAAARRAFVIRR